MKSILVDSELMKDYPATPGKAFTHLVENFNHDRDVHLANLFKLLTGAVDGETVGKIFELLREDERENEIEIFRPDEYWSVQSLFQNKENKEKVLVDIGD